MSKEITDKYRIEFGIVGINKLQEYQRGLQATNNELRKLKKKIREQVGASSDQANKLTRLTAQQQLYNAKVKEGIKNLKGNASRLREYANTTKKATKSMGAMAAKVGTAILAFRQLSQFLVTVVKDFAAYERGVKNVTTLLSAEDKNMFSQDLYKGVLEISSEFAFKIKDINNALFNSVSAGIEAGKSIEFLRQASILAIAGVTDLKSAALGLTTVINAYGMEAEEAKKVTEILFTTQKFGVTTVNELSKAIGVVVPFAAASGISFEELGASIAVTTRSGLDAAKTVTALRAAISQMQKPAAESIDLFTKYGIPIGSAEMKAVGFTETLRRLNEVYKESPRDIERMFGNVRGLTAIFSLAGDNAAEYGKFLSELQNETLRAANVTQGAEEQFDSTQFALDQLSAAWSRFKIAFGGNTRFANATMNILGDLESLVTSLTDKLSPTKEEEVASIFDPIMGMLGGDVEGLKKYANSLEEIPAGYKVMLDKIVSYTDKVKPEDVPFLNTDQMTLLKIGSDYADTLDVIALNEQRRIRKALQEEEAANEARALLTKEYRELELSKRNKFNEAAHKANVEFSNGETKTAEEVKNHKLKLIDLELEYLDEALVHKGISASEEVAFQKRKNALLLKQLKIKNGHEIAEEKRKLDVIKSLQQDAMNKATSFITESLNISLENKQKDFDAEKEKIDKEVEFGLISKKQAEKEKEEIDKKAFRTRKKHEKKMALINYIKELTNIRVQAAANPLNAVTFGAAGISQYAILAALATAAYAGNLANINAQKFAKGGMVHGNSHAQGGEKFAVGGRVVELEGGEAVINKRSTAMFGDTLSAMNVAGGGTSFSAPNFGSKDIINYRMLADAVSKNINVVLPVESLNKVQNKVKVIESQSKY